MSLNDWLNNGWLVAHKTSKREIRDLLGVADRDLNDCKAKGLSADWKLNIAYNAGCNLRPRRWPPPVIGRDEILITFASSSHSRKLSAWTPR